MKESAARYFSGLILVSLMFVAAPVIAQDESAASDAESAASDAAQANNPWPI